MSEKDVLEFRLKDYELKVTYLVGEFERMWTRFQFLLGIETLLVGLFFAPLQPTRLVSASFFAAIGLAASLFWYVVGAEDKYLVWLYRGQVQEAAGKVIEILGISDGYQFVGQTEVKQNPRFISPIEWRYRAISITTLVAIFPILTVFLWLVLLIVGR